MKKLIIMPVLVMIMMLSGCGNAQPALDPICAEMESVYIESESLPGDEYIQGQCTVGDECLNIEIKLRGNSSKEADKKAYTIKFGDTTAFLGMDPAKKWALVSNPFDKSLLRPYIGFTYAKELGINYTPEVCLCKVWINGDYRGVYTAVEPVEAGPGRVEIDPENGDYLLERNIGRFEDDVMYIDSPGGLRFEFNEPEEPDGRQQEQCYELLLQAEQAIFTKDHKLYEKYIDVESFVNFYIFHEMIKDVDFGEYSTRYYFKDGIMYAGPPWDLDLTMGNVSAEKEEFKYASYNDSGDSTQALWASKGDYYYWLCRDPWFMEKVRQRWQAVRTVTENLSVDNELGTNLIDRYLEAHRAELESNYEDAGWPVNQAIHISEWQTPASDYAGNVEILRLWLIKRAAYLDSQFGVFIFTPEKAVI